MAVESDNLVLAHLREIRADIGQMKSKLEDHDRRFDGLDKTLETIKFQMTYTYGTAGIANVNSIGAEAKADAALKRQVDFELDMAAVKQRLVALEERAP